MLPVIAMLVLAAAVATALPARGSDPPPPGPIVYGSGNLEGTELVEEQLLTGALCFQTTKHIFGLQGVGSFYGRTLSGQEVIYRTALADGQTLYGDGTIHLEVENTQTYYHGPFGTHGSDASCSAATAGSPVPAVFRLFAADHVYRLDGSSQVPCTGGGSFARGDRTNNDSAHWYAQWTLGDDCVVIGNVDGVPGTGVAKAGSAMTHSGQHDPCFGEFACTSNIRADYKQYLPVEGPYVAVAGASSARTGAPVSLIAAVKYDGEPVPNAPVTFSVAGPAPSSPAQGAAVTGADGTATFTFTAAVDGNYTVTATASFIGATTSTSVPGTPPPTASGSHVVTFTPPSPPTVTLAGPAHRQTDENLTVTATATNLDNPAPGTQVDFSVVGAGQATPASGRATTDANGQATFTFAGSRAGSYTVSATATIGTDTTSASHPLTLEIRTLYREGALVLGQGEASSSAAFVDPPGRFAYFLAGNDLVKVDTATLQRVGAVQILGPNSAVMTPDGRYAFVGTSRGTVVKVDLGNFLVSGTLTVNGGTLPLTVAAVDPGGTFAYFAWDGSPDGVARVDLSTFTQAGTLDLPGLPTSAVVDADGSHAYIGVARVGEPGQVVKIDLATFQPVASLTFNGRQEAAAVSSAIDPAGRFAYFGAQNTAPGLYHPGAVVKVDLDTFTRVGAVGLVADGAPRSALIDPAGRFAYFGMHTSPTQVVRLDLRAFAVTMDIALAADETGAGASVMSPDGSHAYFGAQDPNTSTVTGVPPGRIVKVALTRPSVAWLVVGDDSYTTPYAGPLSVPAPGVLANDADTQDADPVGATVVDEPAHGSLVMNRDGSFSYTPTHGFSGTDTFTYKVDDGMDYSAPATVSVTVAPPPEGVQTVDGSAVGFATDVSLFGGPAETRGPAPAVSLAPNGGTASATDPDGAVGQYGPAYIFENHGALTVTSTGTTGPTGSVTSTATVEAIEDNDPFRAPGPNGQVRSTCTATRSGLTGSARVVGGRLVVHTDPSTGEATEEVAFPATWDPAPNTTYEGALDHVGDRWRIVFNEHVHGPDSITVNAVHLYLLGPAAVGDMVIASSRCGIESSDANAAPHGADDAYAATTGQTLTIPGPGVVANDTDPDGAALSASIVSPTPPPTSGGGTWAFPGQPAHGTLRLGADGSFTYTPEPGYSGPDAFTYRVFDARGSSDTATVALDVAPFTGPRVSIGDVSVSEGDAATRAAILTVSLSKPSTSAVSVAYATANGTATAGSDYTAKSGTLSFAPGATSAKVKVPVAGDT
ncbi:MAG TPA: Ig-like domain-containing protein, partial [Acidimicrobiales bacterium]|nr:Ig-like domain-containing protein [Acidimicrobiales bacterium]